jgi:hypothetical protein
MAEIILLMQRLLVVVVVGSEEMALAAKFVFGQPLQGFNK